MKGFIQAIVEFFKALFGGDDEKPSRGPATPPPPSPEIGEIIFQAYITGYGWIDNTPPGNDISHPVIHQLGAGGIGTYADPITVAVGHSIMGGDDYLDYEEGTLFYIPAFKRYFIVEDTCGDGPSPQDGPCHCGKDGKPWLDVWVGGSETTAPQTLACQEKITGFHTVIQNPAPNYQVSAGPLFDGKDCTQVW